MLEIVETIANNSASIGRDANSTIWTPTSHEFSMKFAKSRQNGEKIMKKGAKKSKNPHFLSDIYFNKSDSYQTIEVDPMLLAR
jgi:hypothetical protein